MKRYECKFRKTDGRWAIVDNKIQKAIGSLSNRIVADTVVFELNKMEAANA